MAIWPTLLTSGRTSAVVWLSASTYAILLGANDCVEAGVEVLAVKIQRMTFVFSFLLALALMNLHYGTAQGALTRFPENMAVGVNPDTHLVLTFANPPTLGKFGQIRVYDATDHRLVDTLDMSIPAGPDATWRGQTRPSDTRVSQYQVTTIGGMSGFHFHPVIIHGNVATIYLHNHHLEYRRRYIVQIDLGVLTTANDGFAGISGDRGWTFTTKDGPPPADATRVLVATDGTGDFNTIQGAVDFVPGNPPQRVTIFIKNGNYEEIVFFRNKANLTIRGEDRDKVQVGYGNSSLFNPPANPPVARDAFTVANSTGIELINFSLNNYISGQAGALSISGDKNILSRMNILRSGDTLQTRGRLYVTDSKLVGEGDSIIGVGPFFCNRCDLHSWGAYVWPRNPQENHGYVFVDSTFDTPEGPDPLGPLAGPVVLARSPNNHGINYSNAEVVLINCHLKGIPAVGWGPMADDASKVHLWEYNSTNLEDGKPVDVSQRSPLSRQLTMDHDAQTIANYSNPTYILGGWTPIVDH